MEFHAKILVGLSVGQDLERNLESDERFVEKKNAYHYRESNTRLLVCYLRWLKYFGPVIY